MATLQSLSDLGQQAETVAPEAPKYVKKVDAQGRAYATGKRKDAVARVWIKPGSGKIVVNGRALEVYFARPVLRMILKQPLGIVNRDDQYDITVTVKGGGLSGQAGWYASTCPRPVTASKRSGPVRWTPGALLWLTTNGRT